MWWCGACPVECWCCTCGGVGIGVASQWYWGNEMDASWTLGWKSLRNIRCGGLLHLHPQSGSEWKVDFDIEPAAKPSIFLGRTQQISPKLRVSDKATFTCRKLVSTVLSDESYDDIRRSSGAVFFFLCNLLSEDQQFRGRLASQDEYQKNINDFEEDKLAQLLKNVAEKKSSNELFHHSTSYLHLTRTPWSYSTFRSLFETKSPSETGRKESDKSVNGVQCL